jgi:DNA helicase-2/ATP-dependent DNA helicase PcrA
MHFAGRPLGEVIVLYRAHYQAMELQMELTRQGIPFTITSGVRFFEQAHIRDMTAHLRFVHNPADSVAFTRLMALLPRVGPRTATRVFELAQNEARKTRNSIFAILAGESILAKVPEESRDDFHDLALTLQNMDEAQRGTSAPPAIPEFLERQDSGDDLFSAAPAKPAKPAAGTAAKAGSAGEFSQSAEVPFDETTTHAAPAEVVRIGIEGWYGDFMRNIYTDWESRREDLNALVNFAEKYTDMSEMLAQLVLQTTETGNKSTEPDNDTLRLTTVHQAKGLEFPVVFVLGCAQGLFPLKRAVESGDISEERRLFYVATTRAMDNLYLISPRIQRSYDGVMLLEVSEFISDLSPDTYDMINVPRMRG